ncbi:hypothetical protein D9M69_372310 [compost metagenome]
MDALGELHAALQAAGEYRAGQAVLAAVGQLQGVLGIARGLDAHQRAEDFLAGDFHVGGDVAEHMGRHDVALGLAAHQQGGALGLGGGDLLLQTSQLLGVDHRADHGFGLARVTVWQGLDALDEALGEGFQQRLLDDDAVDRHADLALVQELAHHGGVDRLFQVGVGQDHEGAVAAQLERDVLEMLAAAGDAADVAAHLGGTGEGDERRNRMLDEGVADFRARAHHHAEHARRQAGFLEDARQQQAAGDRGVAGRLDHHRVAQGQGRGQGAGGEVQGEVPRADHADHAQGHAVHAALLAGDVGGDDAPVHAVRQAGRLQGDGAGGAPFDLRLDAGAAGLADDPVDDLLAALVEDLHRFQEYPGTLGRRLGGPFPLAVAGRAVGRIEVLAAGQGDAQQALVVVGIEHFQLATGTAGAPLPGKGL